MTGVSDAAEPQRLARALLVRVARCLPALAPAPRAEALRAVDAFIARPSPASFLVANRTLGGALRARFVDTTAPRRRARGFEALRAAGVDEATLARLEQLPFDGRTAARLDALGALALARHELSGRAAAAAAMLRARLATSPLPKPPRKR